MPKPKNTLLRVIIPLVVAVAAIGIAATFLRSNKKPLVPGAPPAAPASAPGSSPSPATQTPPPGPTAPPTTAHSSPAPSAPPTGAQSIGGTLHARVWTGVAPPAPLGKTDPADPRRPDQRSAEPALVEFTLNGAGIKSLTLAHHFDTIKEDVSTVLQQSVETTGAALVSMAALGVYINDRPFVRLDSKEAWHPIEGVPGRFEAEVLDENDQPVLHVERRYAFRDGSYGLTLTQRVTNLTVAPVQVRWLQLGPIDLPMDSFGYGGDKRRVRFGYLLGPTADPSRRVVVYNEFIQDHPTLLGGKNGLYPTEIKLWPNQKSLDNAYELVWGALTNRYFAVAVHGPADPTPLTAPVTLPKFATIDRVVLPRFSATNPTEPDPVMALRLTSAPAQIAPGATLDLSLGIYAGPMSRLQIDQDAPAKAYGLGGLVLFNFGGPCGFCTFDFLTALLFGLLHILHDYLVFDWALAIILLVVCVRTCLHPVTKWSQIRMQRFAKQMQGMAPKQKAIQERYKDDRNKLKEETARLWREEGISPMGALGCLPMFLQTPVWIALYATLYFVFELRHQPAFFGVCQKLTGGNWSFLGDLAEPDRFIYFARTVVTLPLLGPITSVNILPLILGVVFFIHQKYLTPPPTAPLTPEQETQQKMVKIMTVVMFPLFMYNAPSGLALYFCANSTLGIFENKYIREHINKYDLLSTTKGGKPKPGFMARLQAAALERARRVEQSRKQPRGPKR